MRILSLGLDNSILDKTSALAGRVVEYGELVEKYTVVVPEERDEELILSDRVKIYGVAGENKFIKLFNLWRQTKILLENAAYDVITVQDQYYLALIGLCLAKKFKIGLEIQVHGFEKYYGLRKLIARYVLPRADAVRAVSQRLKKLLVEEFGVKEEKITVVPIFVDTNLSLRDRAGGRSNLTNSEANQRLPRRPEYGSPRNDINAFIFLTVGRLVPVKNISLQIAAMKEVIKKYINTELWVIGDGPERNNYDTADNIKFLGRREDVAPYYAKANAFLLTSDYEGWGLAVIEAAGFALPIIMTDVGCAGEVIKDGENGLVVPVGDKEKLVGAMLKIIEDENLRKRLGASAKLAVSRLPDKEQTLNLYKASWQKALVK